MAKFHTHEGSTRRFFSAARDGLCRLCRVGEAAEQIAAAMPALNFEPTLTSSPGGDVNYVGDMAAGTGDAETAEAKRQAFYARLGVDIEKLRARFHGNEKAMARWLRTEAVRQSRTIVLNWQGLDGEKGRTVIGVNNEANRVKAGQLQQAAGKKGFKAVFSLVKA
jgi:hypothetical protein